MSSNDRLLTVVRIVGATILLGIALVPGYAGLWAACHDGSTWCGTTPDLKAAFGYLAVAGAMVGLSVSLIFGVSRTRYVVALTVGGSACGVLVASLAST